MTTFQAFILGLVQGITEFLPISSSAHLVLVPWFFKWEDPGLAFDIFLHLGTLVAVLGYFFRDWMHLIKAGVMSIIDRRIGYDRDRMLFWLIMVGTVPAGLAGLLFGGAAEATFRDPILIAIPLAAIGFLLYWIDGTYPALRGIEDLGFKEAIWIGLAQACAIIPGVSRSGSTMTMARVLGLSREAAARYSFLLSLPIVVAAAMYSWKKLASQTGVTISINCLLAGFFSSAFFGMLSIHFLLRWLRSTDFRVFAWYRVLLAASIILWSVLPLWKR